MTLSEFREMVLSLPSDPNAQVYVEVEIANEIFLQKPISNVRFEEGAASNTVIIEGISGDQTY